MCRYCVEKGTTTPLLERDGTRKDRCTEHQDEYAGSQFVRRELHAGLPDTQCVEPADVLEMFTTVNTHDEVYYAKGAEKKGLDQCSIQPLKYSWCLFIIHIGTQQE